MDIDGNNALQIKAIGVVISTFETLPYAQSHAENAFFRFKQSFGGRLRAKRDASQERETSLACALLNRMRDLGRPESYAVS